MPRKKKSQGRVREGGVREEAAKGTEEEVLGMDEISRACQEIQEEMKRQQNKPKNRKKLAVEKAEETVKSEAFKELINGRKVESLFELDMADQPNSEVKTRLEELISIAVEVLISHLEDYGACVIDDFLGEERGNQVLKDAQSMDNFADGQLAKGASTNTVGGASPSIRSDQIAWTDGQEASMPGIHYLVKVLDSIILAANRKEDAGSFSKFTISGRTKAMVACYPGAGTHYVTHVDNPNRDGRCITAIYYLNKAWDSQRDGGALRMYSKYGEGPVAEVEPLFDRMLFFWSDRRNPHEVLPAFRDRLAVTVWYMDQEERRGYEQRRERSKEQEKL